MVLTKWFKQNGLNRVLKHKARPDKARPDKARPEKARPDKARPGTTLHAWIYASIRTSYLVDSVKGGPGINLSLKPCVVEKNSFSKTCSERENSAF